MKFDLITRGHEGGSENTFSDLLLVYQADQHEELVRKDAAVIWFISCLRFLFSLVT